MNKMSEVGTLIYIVMHQWRIQDSLGEHGHVTKSAHVLLFT